MGNVTVNLGFHRQKWDENMDFIAQTIGKVIKKSKGDWIKRKSAPKYYPSQKEMAKKAAGILRRYFFPSSGLTNIVMDDESLFRYQSIGCITVNRIKVIVVFIT